MTGNFRDMASPTEGFGEVGRTIGCATSLSFWCIPRTQAGVASMPTFKSEQTVRVGQCQYQVGARSQSTSWTKLTWKNCIIAGSTSHQGFTGEDATLRELGGLVLLGSKLMRNSTFRLKSISNSKSHGQSARSSVFVCLLSRRIRQSECITTVRDTLRLEARNLMVLISILTSTDSWMPTKCHRPLLTQRISTGQSEVFLPKNLSKEGRHFRCLLRGLQRNLPWTCIFEAGYD